VKHKWRIINNILPTVAHKIMKVNVDWDCQASKRIQIVIVS